MSKEPGIVEKEPVLARKRKPNIRSSARQNKKKSSTQTDKVSVESESVHKKSITPRSIVIDGLEFEKFGVECEINDELEDLAEAEKVKSKTIITGLYDTMKQITYNRHNLSFGSLEPYHLWLTEVHGIDSEMIPLEPKMAKVKPGLKLPYPSGRRWKELN